MKITLLQMLCVNKFKAEFEVCVKELWLFREILKWCLIITRDFEGSHTIFWLHMPILCMTYGLTFYMDSPAAEMEKFDKYWQTWQHIQVMWRTRWLLLHFYTIENKLQHNQRIYSKSGFFLNVICWCLLKENRSLDWKTMKMNESVLQKVNTSAIELKTFIVQLELVSEHPL